MPGFGGFDAAAFPVPMDPPPMQPAGWAFAIWGPIYAALVAMAAYGLWRRRTDPAWDATRAPLILSLAIGAVWLPVAERAPVLATGLIWLMLATALLALKRAGRRDPFALRAPIGLYAGWLTAAAPVSLGVVAAGHGVAGLDPVGWSVITLIAAFLVAVPMVIVRPSPAYVAALAWAAAGIVTADTVLIVRAYAGVGAVLIVVLLATQFRRLAAATPARHASG